MKRILSSSSITSSDLLLDRIAEIANTLSDVALAESDEQAIQIYSKSRRGNVTSKHQAIKALMQVLNFGFEEYNREFEAEMVVKSNSDIVIKKIVNSITDQFHIDLKRVTSGAFSSSTSDKVDFDKFEDVCRYIQKTYDLKDRDGAMLGGSWTAHHYKYLGIYFSIEYVHGYLVVNFKL